ncbi:BppU family phage baseplate upper protein [Enterococcus sp. AZ102]|uniref:BppU family phage baseplate upper protein n=1 Tax=Enterococcus sp. AZ102 TaxID=2774865 RepID=UPI003F25316C
MALVTHKLTLSVLEQNYDAGNFKVRQNDESTQLLDVQIVENGLPKSFEGLTPFFCVFPKGMTGNGISEDIVLKFNAKNGTLQHIMSENSMIYTGRIEAYFSFRKELKNGEWIEQFSTRSFFYSVEKSIYKVQIKDSNYFWTFEELYRKFNQYIENGETSWEDFIESNREILESIDPNGKILEELIDARASSDGERYENIGERLNNMLNYESQVFSQDLDVSVERIHQTQEFKKRLDTDPKVLKIVYFRDLHYMMRNDPKDYGEASSLAINQLKASTLLNDVADAYVLNGDNVNGNENIDLVRTRNRQVANIAREAAGEKAVFMGLGNHDDKGDYGLDDVYFPRPYDKIMHLDEYVELWQLELNDRRGVSRPQGKTYSYKDFPSAKVRLIMMNGFENPEVVNAEGNVLYPRINSSVFDQAQINWIAQTLLTTPKNYAVIAFTHAPILGYFANLPYWGTAKYDFYNVGHELVLNLFAAFKTGSRFIGEEKNETYPSKIDVDFTNRGTGKVVGLFFGHEHRELPVQVRNGINGILRTCNVPKTDATNQRILNTDSEFAIDVIEIDTEKNSCVVKRCGAGNDLMFTF